MASVSKRQNGQFYTTGNPFQLSPFQKWVKRHELKDLPVLEPFAGANNLIRALREIGMAKRFRSYDIAPAAKEVVCRDTLVNFPAKSSFCVTNPPWLAKNSAKRRGLAFPETRYDDLYKYALEKCLHNCAYVAALIPATFLRSGEFRDRLDTVIFLHDQNMFADTDNPVCLALFSPKGSRIEIYDDGTRVGYLNDLEEKLPAASPYVRLTFNHPEGALGLVAIDNTRGPSIRFLPGKELSAHEMKETSRMITRIKIEVPELDQLIDRLNADLAEFRKSTSDVFLTPFKGLRKDGQYRRRIDYRLARDFIAKCTDPRHTLGV